MHAFNIENTSPSKGLATWWYTANKSCFSCIYSAFQGYFLMSSLVSRFINGVPDMTGHQQMYFHLCLFLHLELYLTHSLDLLSFAVLSCGTSGVTLLLMDGWICNRGQLEISCSLAALSWPWVLYLDITDICKSPV